MSTRQSNQENSSIFESNRSRRQQQPTPSNIPSNQQQEPLNSSPSHSDQDSKACCFCWCCCCSCSWYVEQKFLRLVCFISSSFPPRYPPRWSCTRLISIDTDRERERQTDRLRRDFSSFLWVDHLPIFVGSIRDRRRRRCFLHCLSRFRRGSPHHDILTDSSSTFIHIQRIGPLLLFSSPGEFARLCEKNMIKNLKFKPFGSIRRRLKYVC